MDFMWFCLDPWRPFFASFAVISLLVFEYLHSWNCNAGSHPRARPSCLAKAASSVISVNLPGPYRHLYKGRHFDFIPEQASLFVAGLPSYFF